jgi:hypothetical protein
MSRHSQEEKSRSGQPEIQVDDYDSKEGFYQMMGAAPLDLKSNLSRLSPIPTEAVQLASYSEVKQSGRDESIDFANLATPEGERLLLNQIL